MTSIIIVSYNSGRFIDDCLKSIFASSYKKFNVIVVDNNSKDGSIEKLSKKFPKITIIKNKQNLGFATGVNIGIRRAISLKANNVFLINPDTIIDKNCLRELNQNNNKKTILQPFVLLYRHKKTNKINSSGHFLHYLGFTYCNDYKKDESKVSDKLIASSSGSAMFIPLSIVKKIGYFTDYFFLYHEDLDFSWRWRLAGGEVKLITAAKVWHKYHFSRNKNKLFYVERNRLLFLLKNYQTRTLILISPILLITEIGFLFFSVFSGWGFVKIKSFISALASMPAMLSERKKIIRSKKDRELLQYLQSSIYFPEYKIPFSKILNAIYFCYWSLIKKII